jgi:hypothetical protein
VPPTLREGKKKKLPVLKVHLNSKSTIVGNFNILFSLNIDYPDKKVNKETSELLDSEFKWT